MSETPQTPEESLQEKVARLKAKSGQTISGTSSLGPLPLSERPPLGAPGSAPAPEQLDLGDHPDLTRDPMPPLPPLPPLPGRREPETEDPGAAILGAAAADTGVIQPGEGRRRPLTIPPITDFDDRLTQPPPEPKGGWKRVGLGEVLPRNLGEVRDLLTGEGKKQASPAPDQTPIPASEDERNEADDTMMRVSRVLYAAGDDKRRLDDPQTVTELARALNVDISDPNLSDEQKFYLVRKAINIPASVTNQYGESIGETYSDAWQTHGFNEAFNTGGVPIDVHDRRIDARERLGIVEDVLSTAATEGRRIDDPQTLSELIRALHVDTSDPNLTQAEILNLVKRKLNEHTSLLSNGENEDTDRIWRDKGFVDAFATGGVPGAPEPAQTPRTPEENAQSLRSIIFDLSLNPHVDMHQSLNRIAGYLDVDLSDPNLTDEQKKTLIRQTVQERLNTIEPGERDAILDQLEANGFSNQFPITEANTPSNTVDVIADMPPDATPEQKGKARRVADGLKDFGYSYLESLSPRGKNKLLWGVGLLGGAAANLYGLGAAKGIAMLGLQAASWGLHGRFRGEVKAIAQQAADEIHATRTSLHPITMSRNEKTELSSNFAKQIRELSKERGKGRLEDDEFYGLLTTAIEDFKARLGTDAFDESDMNKLFNKLQEKGDFLHNTAKVVRTISSGVAAGSLTASLTGAAAGFLLDQLDIDFSLSNPFSKAKAVMGIVPNQPPNPNIPLSRPGFPFDEQTLRERGLSILSNDPDTLAASIGPTAPFSPSPALPPINIPAGVEPGVITEPATFQAGLDKNFPGMTPDQAFGTNGDTVTTVGLKGAEVQYAIDQLGLVENVNNTAAAQAEQILRDPKLNLDQATLDKAKAAAKVSKEQAQRLANEVFGYGKDLEINEQTKKAYESGLEALARQNAIDSVAHNPLIEFDKIPVELGSEDGTALLKSFADEGMRPDIWSKTGAKFWGMLAEGVQLPNGSTHEFISKSDWVDRIVTTIRSGNTEAINVFRELNILNNPDILSRLGVDAAKVTELLNQINQGGEGANEAAKNLKELVGKLPNDESLFDKDKLHKLIVNASKGDADSLKKLHEIFHFRPAGELRLPKNWKLMLGYMGDRYGSK